MPLSDGSSYVRAPRGSRVVLVVLRAPGGQPAVDPDLAPEDAGDSRREGPIAAAARGRIDEPEAIGTAPRRGRAPGGCTMVLSLNVM